MIIPGPLRPMRGAVFLLVASLAACGVFKNNDDAQALLNQRLIGMPLGTFIDRYGTPYRREAQADNSTHYAWRSSARPLGAGSANVDQSFCTLRFVVDPRGRIASVEVVLNSPGRVSTSRCGEIFGSEGGASGKAGN